MSRFKRIFLIVMDSLGIGNAKDAISFKQNKKINDFGSNTFKHINDTFEKGLKIPNLEKLGIANIVELKNINKKANIHSILTKLNEASNGKDTMTGHWEMMGIKTVKPFQTFTETGFPRELIEELEKKCGRKVIGNYAASGTEILKDLGEEQIQTGSLIVYTSSDSVLQICGHEKYIGLEELYRYCKIARELCMKPEWFVGRIIARPFIGENKNEFKRTSNRHDYTISPTEKTVLDILKEKNIETISIGKINDIFNGCGISKSIHTSSNSDGMNQTLSIIESKDFKEGLCFINLVEFDSEYGHRRNPKGYGEAIEQFDSELQNVINCLNEDDLLMITADHGNDPTWPGTDHTREQVPLIIYSKSITNGGIISERNSFADIGATILSNFNLNKPNTLIGEIIKEVL